MSEELDKDTEAKARELIAGKFKRFAFPVALLKAEQELGLRNGALLGLRFADLTPLVPDSPLKPEFREIIRKILEDEAQS